jgi:hypothetical protein
VRGLIQTAAAAAGDVFVRRLIQLVPRPAIFI